jgi:hypothetical protein
MYESLILLTLVAVLLLASKWHDKPAHQPLNDEGACEPQRARLEMFAILSFVVFSFAALLFCAYIILAKCRGISSF